MLTHLRFDLDLAVQGCAYPDSQELVYSLPHDVPLFIGSTRSSVNVHYVLHALNFWKYHMTEEKNYTLYNRYMSESPQGRVQPWRRALKSGAELIGRSWKGVYSYMNENELEVIRSPNREQKAFEDRWSDDKDAFQVLDVHFPGIAACSAHWPDEFESHLRGLTHPSLCALKEDFKAQKTTKASSPISKRRYTTRTNAGKRRKLSPGSPISPSSLPDSPSGLSPNYLSHVSQVSERRRQEQEENSDMASFIPYHLGNEIDSEPLSPTADSPESPIAPRAIPFHGTGMDEQKFITAGWLTPLPSQDGFPGFQRFTMIKVFAVHRDNDDDSVNAVKDLCEPACLWVGVDSEWPGAIDSDGAWVYEGVVLPGAEVIVGRWWRGEPDNAGAGVALSDQGFRDGAVRGPELNLRESERRNARSLYSGPFMFWCVDP
ncbi:MAG: hypothetical protein M1828_004456 [Chrysothrix sp. TS-e1954]|nr:MAG: hypothetical protein M1828_004456 [Chrysothrix sp. TS-e1954]